MALHAKLATAEQAGGEGAARVQRLVLTDADVVAPSRVVARGTVVVEEGRIVEILDRTVRAGRGVVSLGGNVLLPGLVDLHNDAIEQRVEPRPGARFDPKAVARHLDRTLAMAGVTTQLHAITFGSRDDAKRPPFRAAELCQVIRGLRADPSTLIDHHVLHRLDLAAPEAVDPVLEEVAEAALPVVSLNHHAPGHGQYRDLAAFRRDYRESLPAEAGERAMDALLATRLADAATIDRVVEATTRRIEAERAGRGLLLVSHDDDTAERVERMRALGCTIAEFPVSVEAAERAAYHGMSVLMGAPNLVRGGSLSGNVGAQELLGRGLVDGLVADYYAPALLTALFSSVERGLADLPTATRLVTANPAATIGLTDRGRIETGRRADLIVVAMSGRTPLVEATVVGGRLRWLTGAIAEAACAAGDGPEPAA